MKVFSVCFILLLASAEVSSISVEESKNLVSTNPDESLLKRFPVILTHWFLGTMLVFWGLCCLLCLKLCLKHSYLLCLNLIWVQLWHFHAPLFLQSTPHTRRITISCLVCYKNKWDLSNSVDIKKYWQILWGGNRWFFVKDYCKFRKTLMTF